MINQKDRFKVIYFTDNFFRSFERLPIAEDLLQPLKMRISGSLLLRQWHWGNQLLLRMRGGGHKEAVIDGITRKLIDDMNVDRLVAAVKETTRIREEYKEVYL